MWIFLGTCEEEVEEPRVRSGMGGKKKKIKKIKEKFMKKKSGRICKNFKKNKIL